MEIEVTINGTPQSLRIQPGDILLDVLRREGYLGVKRGCQEGACGTCSVLLDGWLVNSCLVFAGSVDGRTVTTIEGLGRPSEPHPLQQAFVDAGAVQCGYCIPGMILATKALLDRDPQPSDEAIYRALDGNLCRCTGYVKILDAVRNAAAQMMEAGDE